MHTKELPQNLKFLYRHWPFHTSPVKRSSPSRAKLKNISWFIKERINIWKKKTAGAKPPFTKDPILAKYRFCNVFREFDKQTTEFHELLNPLRDNFPLWLLNMFYCRMVARTETIKNVGLLSFNKRRNSSVYKKLTKYPRPKFGTPYVFPISVIQKSATNTRELFLTKYLPLVIRKVAKEISTWQKISAYDGVEKILPIFGFNLHFLWTEVLIDVAYQFPHLIDLYSRFPVGPGALPTLSKINKTKDPSLLVVDLSNRRLSTGITYNGKPLRLSAENWEGVACEFRKYNNLKQGRGRKRIYRGL